jgi:bifunctional non-homologous end joining protein LigD
MSTELENYRSRRDFERTPEPAPKPGQGKGPLIFVVQKHRARALHYDFRLELDGVLKSWSVPKGPSFDPTVKRLAVMTEDHPLEYAGFEGIIPKGEYGAGEVIVWDAGTYSPDETGKLYFDDRNESESQIRQGLEKGKIAFTLRGHKLKGSWTLVKIQKRARDWLLIKHRDNYAGADTDILQEDASVVSSRTIEDMKEDNLPKAQATPLNPKDITGAIAAPMGGFMAPMLASLAKEPFSHPDWSFESKLDGYRTLANIRDGKVTLFSRRGNDITERFVEMVADLRSQPVSQAVLDGEVIALDKTGKPCFQCLQDYIRSRNPANKELADTIPLVYYVFDILYLDGYDLRGADLRSRRALLESVLKPTDRIRLTDSYETDGKTVYEAAVKSGLEGVMAKRLDSVYESGRRSGNWLKVKAMLSDEFVIGGYSVSQSGRKETFSSLLIGYFDDAGKLIFAGHVGSGFDEPTLAELKKRLDVLRIDDCPFAEVPALNAPTTWVRPELVAEVKFSEWTQDGRLRIPVFLRLREDKSPAEVRRRGLVAVPPEDKVNSKSNIENVLEQLQNRNESFIVEVEGNKISLSNVDKALWPETSTHPAVTKRDLMIYLTKVSNYFLNQMKDRPLTLSRYPDGIHGEHFYQKHWNHPVPEFVQTAIIKERQGIPQEYMICNNLSTLLWLGQIANIEFHTWFSRIVPEPDIHDPSADTDRLLDYPDFVVFDLDPYIYSGKEAPGDEPDLNKRGFDKVCEVALWVKEILDELSLNAFVKTSGKTGLHIYVPVIRDLDYKELRYSAELIGRFLLQSHPDDITLQWKVEKRAGKIFFDYGQNVRGKTLASAYSPRPAPEATVSTPLRWNELGKVYPTDFTILTLPDRLQKTGDLWTDLISAKRDLRKILEAKKDL